MKERHLNIFNIKKVSNINCDCAGTAHNDKISMHKLFSILVVFANPFVFEKTANCLLMKQSRAEQVISSILINTFYFTPSSFILRSYIFLWHSFEILFTQLIKINLLKTSNSIRIESRKSDFN